MKNLFISEILLISQKEKKARIVEFDQNRTLIYGKNHTGKSSLIKSIYKTFGAEPLMNPKFEDANVVSCVRFKVETENYEIIHDGKLFGVYKNNTLIKKFNSITSELSPFLGDLFDFNPLFQARSGDFITPPPAFLFLPYYVDQDRSWSNSWDSFKALQQIKDYRTQSIYYHSGIRPNDYYSTKKEIDQFIRIIEDTDKEQKMTSKILSEIKQKLSQAEFNLDVDAFKNEIVELLTEAEILKSKEEKVKNELNDLYHLKAAYDAQINIVKHAILESHNDLKYLTDNLPEIIACPTCGAEYHNSFAERFEIAKDEQKTKDLLMELTKEVKEINDKIGVENDSLSNTSSEVHRINEILAGKKGELKLNDIIENAEKNQVKTLFADRYDTLKEILMDNILEKERLEGKLKQYENKERKENIVEYYRHTMNAFLMKLDVHSLKDDEYKNITSKIENLETGSSRPRALIAYYFTFFHLMKKFSSTTYCPLIVDSPNQQDQDIEHIDKIMGFINLNQPDNSQLILGLAETYDVDFKCRVVELKEKYSLLQRNDYENAYEQLNNKLEKLWFT